MDSLPHLSCFPPLFHHLDNFLTLGPPSSSVCQSNVATAFTVFARLGLPLHHEKCEGPATCLVFFGIELNSVTQIARLLADKFARIVALLRSWSNKRMCHSWELESLIGHLHHACQVVRPGRTSCAVGLTSSLVFVTALIRSASVNLEFRRDTHGWLSFFQKWNGISFNLSPGIAQLPDVFAASDAAVSGDFGAMWHSHWFVGSWSFLPSLQPIAFMDLLPIVLVAHLWGTVWSRLLVQFRCDKRSVVDVLNAGSARSSSLMHALASQPHSRGLPS
jgi:hypothetical protein